MSVPQQLPDRDSWLLLPSGFRRRGHPLRRWTPVPSPGPTRLSLSISLCRCKPSCLGPEKSPNSPPPGLIVHPSLHDNTRHWRLTRLPRGEKGHNPSPTGRPTLWLSTLSVLSRMGRFMNIFVARWNSPGGLLCLMTLLCRKWKFRKKNSKHNRTEPSLGGGAVDPGFYDILNGNRAASNILRSD